MTEIKKTSTLSGKTLELKKTLTLKNRIQQNMGAGKTNVVQVEVRKKRVINSTQAQNSLTEDAEQKLRLVQQAQKVAEHTRQLEEQREAQRKAEELKRQQEEQELKARQEQEAKEALEKQSVAEVKSSSGKESRAPKNNSRDKEDGDWTERASSKKSFTERRSSKVNLNAYQNFSSLDDDEDEENVGTHFHRRSLASIRRSREKERLKHLESLKTQEKISHEVILPEIITVQELASRMSEKAVTVIKELMKLGMMVTITQTIDADTAELVATELGHTVKRVSESDVEDLIKPEALDESDLVARPPVITVMGHVDHGKTSLLDALRSTHVASGEAGGITQHIGAYQVELENGQKVTFIDTPGHEAFTEMRARGAKITDIVVLVVAANDSVKPQTIEAINHAKAANVPIVVAINKIDVPGANPQKVRTDLLQQGVVVESMGGEVMDVEISAKQRTNLDKLVEAILLQAEILELKASPHRLAEGVIIEAKMDKGRGSVATVLISQGTLKVGDVFVAGKEWGRVRALIDDKGQKIAQALPAQPVEILGLQGVPAAGDDLLVVDSETKAREVSAYRQRKKREQMQVKKMNPAETLFAKIKAGEIKELPVLIKGDVQGSVEALSNSLAKLHNDEVKVSILHSGVGAITESDVSLARAGNALVIGFNVRANPSAREMAKRDGIDIRYYSIIYDVIDDVKLALEGLLTPELKEKELGTAEIRQVISISKVGKVAGCMVLSGLLKRAAQIRLLRDNVVIYTGELSQLRRGKDDVKEVKEGFECGVNLLNYDDIKEGDIIECFEIEKVAVKLNLSES